MTQPSFTRSILVSPAINFGHGPQDHMFFSKELSIEVDANMRSLVISQDSAGKIPAGILDFVRISVTGPDGKTLQAELNHNDHYDQPLGEQYVLSNILYFKPGTNRIRFEFWSHYAPPGPNYASTAVFLVQFVDDTDNDDDNEGGGCEPGNPDCKNRVQVTQSIAGHHMPVAGSFLTRTVRLHVPKAGSRVVMSTDHTGSSPFGIDDWVNVTVKTPSGKVHKGRISENDAFGKKIGEQWVLSNIIPFEAGCHEITCELWNQFVPPGSNAGSSAIWLVST
ncbi:MAG: hypothetical protein ISR54_03685 [Chlorobium phaeobacteroides]|uniref:Uncharacterized protein n=1 Tax=Chlorobium phaeobacteroides (strain BS1) TaxID=331678 RepID=B3ENX5_CHLPB|nr:hypothetical protein [Chlorobium phaeobacteroides]